MHCPFVPVNLCTALRFPSWQIHSLTHSCELPSYWATDMRQAAVAVCTKQISTEPKSHPYPLHIHDGLCAYVCVKFNHLSPANEQSSFPCVCNKPVKGVVTNRALVWAWICARSWKLCTRVSECACPGGGQADRWHGVKQSQWDAFKGAGESPLVKITQSGANEHGSANRGTCQEITQPFWNHSQRFNSGASCSSESSGLLWVFSPCCFAARLICIWSSEAQQSCSAERRVLKCVSHLPRLLSWGWWALCSANITPTAPATIEVLLLLKSRLIKRASTVRQLMRSTPLVAFLSISRCKNPEKPSCRHWIAVTLLTVSYLPLTL